MNKLELDRVKLENRNIKLKCLDDFNDFYGWEIYQHGCNYILYDNQTNEIIEFYKDFRELVNRISGRALDYEFEEKERDSVDYEEYSYLTRLLISFSLYRDSIGNNAYFLNRLTDLNNLEVF